METFEMLPVVLKSFWYVAIPSSLIFLIQFGMSFIGGGDDFDLEVEAEAEVDSDDISLVSFKSLLHFILGFSWTGISFYHTINSLALLISLCVVVGMIFVYSLYYLIKQMHKLAEDNSFRIEHTLFQHAEVYLPIPAQKNGVGKVLVTVKGSCREMDAISVTDQIAAGTQVKVVAIEDDSLLIVQPL
ncbi:NfeD family protein [Persicobacter psychrovividus]|uniref:NfeD-like C-terminal domain-containing protein n=1 Tax=Persicobacter psychrovividus TaxID=387638 RepID=A0ABN6LD11_9BACT|nr:hypothetical protein PEPS_31110 [Persicobacter psychrovividus]